MKRYILLLITCSLALHCKVMIMTHVYNRPDFIQLHARTLNAFLLDDYEYVVFNDAPNDSMKVAIEQTCAQLGIRCFRVPNHQPHRQTPSCRHMDGIKYSFELIGFNHDDILVMLDSDMFLMRPFSIVNHLKNYDIFGIKQTKSSGGKSITHIAPSLVFLDMKTLPNKRSISFEADRVEGIPVDVGGHMYYYLRDNPTVKVMFTLPYTVSSLPMNAQALSELGYDTNTINLILDMRCFEYYLNGTFIHHYAGGSNWPHYPTATMERKKVALNQHADKQIAFYANS